MARFSSRQRLAFMLILLLAFGLRLYRLGADSLWYDETVSAMLAAKSIPAMWTHTTGDIHPPFYYALLHFWVQAAGRSEFAHAFLSLLFGMATIPLITRVGLRLYGIRTALVAALLVAINPFAIWYAQEVRMYTLGVFLLALVLFLTLDFLQRKQGPPTRSLVLYALAAALALWTLYYSAFALVALNLFVIPWLWFRGRTRLGRWLLAQLGALILFLPWLSNALRQALNPPVPPWREPIPLLELLGRAGVEGSAALALGQSVDPARWWPLGILVLLLALIAFLAPSRRWHSGAWWASPALLWSTLLGPVLLIVLVSEVFSPLYHVRYLVLYSTAYPLLVAAGLLFVAGSNDPGPEMPPKLSTAYVRYRRRLPSHPIIAIALALVLLAGSAVSLRNFYNDRYAYEAADDLRGAVDLIYNQIGPNDAVLINAGYLYPAFLTYWPDEIGWLGRLSEYPPADPPANGPVVVLSGHVDGDPDIGWGEPGSDFYAISSADTAERLAQLFSDHNTVWLLRGYDTVNDPGGFIRAWLEDNGTLLLDQVFPGQTFVRVQAWRTTQAPRTDLPSIQHPLQADFSNGIRLLGYDLFPASPQSGDLLRLTLYWQNTSQVEHSYKVFTQLLSPEQAVVSQDDAIPGRGALPTDRWGPGEIVESSFILHLPEALPPGDYQLMTGFYDESSGERLLLRDGGDAVTLTIITVAP